MIPSAVAHELQGRGAPEIVRQWAGRLPSWVEVRELANPVFEREASGLDHGEWAAIQLAQEIHANLLLIDERAGARVARGNGFAVTGTLGVLVEAARSGFVIIDEALARLATTNFRRTDELLEQTRQRARMPRGNA